MANEVEQKDLRTLASLIATIVLPVLVGETLSHFVKRTPWIFGIILALAIPISLYNAVSYLRDAHKKRSIVANPREYALWMSFEAVAILAGLTILVWVAFDFTGHHF